MRKPRLMVMAGGTGGHVFPALAVAQSLRKDGVEVTWLGTKKGIEAKVVPLNDIPLEWVSVEGLRGKGILSLLLAPFKLVRAMWQSARAIKRVQPDCILGMGGFVAGPGGLVARLLGCKLVVHEQNAVAGLTNRYLAKIAHRVLTGFPEVADLPADALWVGNPVRQDIQVKQLSAGQRVNVLVLGGSQGAHSFNQKLPAVFGQLSGVDFALWHQTGRDRKPAVVEKYAEQKLDVRVTEFIDDMAEAYAWADLLVCRAGAMTIAECCAAAKPALLIPFPFSAGDHQFRNAEAMVKAGAGRLLGNQQIDQPEMLSLLQELMADKSNLQVMGRCAASLHKADATQAVAQVCQEYLHA